MSQTDNNELLQAFFSEVSEQLDHLELALSADDAEEHVDIHQIFRDFHTIKSSCAMMDFHSMEKVAHTSEDYLDLVRKGKTALNANAIHQLLTGIDWLKLQIQRIKNTGETPQDNITLLNDLRYLFQHAIDHTQETTESTTQNQSDITAQADDIALSEEEIHEFASACQQELVLGLIPSTEAAQSKRAINKLVSICNLLGFTAVSALLKRFIKASNPPDVGLMTSLAADILYRIALLEKKYHVDCGTHTLHAVYLDTFYADFAQLSGRIDFLLDLMEKDADNIQTHRELEALLQHLVTYSTLFNYSSLLTLLRYTLQTVRSIRRSAITDKHAAFYAIRQAVDFSIAEQLQQGESDVVQKMLQDRLAELNDSIAQALLAATDEKTRQNLANQLQIEPDILAVLAAESIQALENALQNHSVICEVDIDLSAPQDMTETLVQWITQHGTLIHNWSVFSGAKDKTAETCYIRFLVVFDKNIDAVKQSIRQLDNKEQFTKIVDAKKSAQSAPSATEKKSKAEPEKTQSTHASTTLRIDSHTLENITTQTGEIILAHNALNHEIRKQKFEVAITHGSLLLSNQDNKIFSQSHANQWLTIINTLQNSQQKIIDVQEKTRKSIATMQNKIIDLRVTPISAVFNRIPQLVRKMAETQGKKIRLIMEGRDVRIDKGMVDTLMEPLIHLVRNCIDHGIEPPHDRVVSGKPEEATLTLSAHQEGSTLTLEISDNGRGINLPRIRESAIRKGFIKETDVLTDQETCQLIFLPGFSTAETITETSGRGVGMDVVITRINHIGGDIDVNTTPGHGTHFTMTLPLSAAIQGVVMVQSATRTYAIAQTRIYEMLSVPHDAIQTLMGQSTVLLRNRAIPLYALDDLVLEKAQPVNNHPSALQFPPIESAPVHHVVIVGQGKNTIGICVQNILRREDVFVREMHKDLRKLPAICGATVRNNGELIFILDCRFLLQYAGKSILAWLNQREARAALS